MDIIKYFVYGWWKFYLTRPHKFVKDFYVAVKNILHRAWYGYCDMEVWNFCDYEAIRIINIMKQLKATTHHAMPTDIYDDIIKGFEAHLKIDELTIENYDVEKYKRELKELTEILNKGLEVFKNNYGRLWD